MLNSGFNKRTSGILNTIHHNLLLFSYITDGCGLGIIDLESKDLVDLMPLNLEGVQIAAPIMTSQNIAIKDTGGNLYLYEWNHRDQ